MSFAVSLAVLLCGAGARAQASCEQALRCCEALSTSGGGADTTRCGQLSQLARYAPQQCGVILDRMRAGFRAQNRPVPAVCGDASGGSSGVPTGPTGGGGGGGGGAPPTQPQPPGTPTGGTSEGAPSGGPGATPPAGLPPDPVTPTRGTPSTGGGSGSLACTIERVRGRRVIFADQTAQLEARCTGIPSASGRPTAGSPLGVTPGALPGGGRIEVRWSLASGGGTLSPAGGTVTFTNAHPRDGAEDTIVRARIAIMDAQGRELEQVTLPRTVRVLTRDWTLDVSQRFESVCTPVQGGSVVVGFTLTCDGLRAPLRVDDSGAVHNTGAASCTNQLAGAQSCSQAIRATEITAPPADRVTSVAGTLDMESGVMQLNLTGDHYGFPGYTIAGRREDPHPVGFLQLPLTLDARDGANRVFSGRPTPHQGVRSYTLHASH